MRTVRFPENEEFGVGGIGWLSVRSKSGGKCKALGFARGAVDVPDDCELRLNLKLSVYLRDKIRQQNDRTAYQSIVESKTRALYRSLDHLGIHDIQCLSLNDPMLLGELEHIGRLTGIKELAFRGSTYNALNDEMQCIDQIIDLETMIKLEKLIFHFCPVSDSVFVSISKMKSLKTLHVITAPITGEGLRLLKDITLEDLSVTGPKLTIQAFESLGRLKLLKKLRWKGPVSDAGFANLAELPHLCELSLSSTSIEDTDITQLGALTKLQSLSLARTGITDSGLEQIVSMKELRELYLSNTAITDEGVKHIRMLKELQSITLHETQITDISSSYLAELNRLTSVDLSDTAVTSQAIAELSRLPNLKKLEMNNTGVNDSAGLYLAKMDKLKELSVVPYDYRPRPCGPIYRNNYNSGNAITDQGYVCLKTMLSLQMLTLRDSPITDKTLEYLRNHPCIEDLDVMNTAVTDKGLESISTCRNLKYLCVWDTAVTDAGMASLAKLPTLQILNINRTAVTDNGIAYLRDLTTLEELRALDTCITDDGLAAIGNMSNLRKLDITWKDFSHAGLNALAQNRSLRIITIDNPPDVIDPVWDLQEAMPWCLVVPLPND